MTMTDRENLPAVINQQVVVHTGQRGSLVMRGLVAVQVSKAILLRKDEEDQSINRIRKAAEQGDQHAQRQLGNMYWSGDGVEQDDEQAKHWLLKAAENGMPEAQHDLAYILHESGEDDERADGMRWLITAAEQGYGPALPLCADMQEDFDLSDEQRDEFYKRAFAWYEERAEQGDAEMQYECACLILTENMNIESWGADREKGLYWLEAAAEQGYRQACRKLGMKLLKDEGRDGSTHQGIHWLERAAELGDVWACEELGALYLLGHAYGFFTRNYRNPLPKLLEPNSKIAVEWYERAISLGSRSAAYKLGQLYLVGEHLPQDLAAAERWLLHSANAGNGSAQIALGVEYATGIHFKQNADAAIHWLTEASKDMELAALRLGEIYRNGEIVPRNSEKAIEWFTNAAERIFAQLPAMKALGAMYASGEAGTIDLKTANEWYGRVVQICEEKLSEGLPNPSRYAFEVAELYDVGAGVQRNIEKAINLYTQAARKGHTKAIERLHELGINWKTSQ